MKCVVLALLIRAKRILESDFGDSLEGAPFWAFTKGRIDSSALGPPIHDQVDRLYRLDDGVPYRVGGVLGVLMVPTFPVIKQDPEKPLRAVAVAGWSALRRDQSDQIGNFMNRLRESPG
jgi:hypothetical protein